MGFNLSELSNFTLQDSGILLPKAILGSTITQYVNLQPGYPESQVNINVLGLTAGFTNEACGWTSAGATNFTAITVNNTTKSWKQSLCLSDLRSYYLSTMMDASAFGEKLPYEQVISDTMVKQTRLSFETDICTQMITAITVANGAAAGPTGSWATNAYDKAVATINALPLAVSDRDDIVMFMSFANFRYLNTDLISKNLFHYNTGSPVQAGVGQSILIPGTSVRAVPLSGLGSSPKVYCGPKEHLVVTVGVTTDEDTIESWFSRDFQEIRMLAKYTSGFGAIVEECVYTAGA